MILLILFYLFLWWSIRKAPVMKDDERDVRRISRLLERLNEKWSRNKKCKTITRKYFQEADRLRAIGIIVALRIIMHGEVSYNEFQ